MSQFSHRLKLSFQNNPYLRFIGLLLLTMTIIIGGLWTSECNECESDAQPRKGEPTTLLPSMSGLPRYTSPGQKISRKIKAEPFRSPYPDKVTYEYDPPEGSTNIGFFPPPDPGGPPYK